MILPIAGGRRPILFLWALIALAAPRDVSSAPVARFGPKCPDGLSLLLDRAAANRWGLTVGDRVGLSSAPTDSACGARVEGIYRPPPDPASLATGRPRVLLHLPQLARLLGREDEVDRFSLRLTPGTDSAATAAALQALMPGTEVFPTARVAERSSRTFLVVRRFHRAIAFITVGAGAVFLLCIMTLKVQERRREVAALRLIGVSRSTLFLWLMLEAAVLSLLGSLIGLGIGGLASLVVNHMYQRLYHTTLLFSIIEPSTALLALALGLGLGAVAGVAAAWRLLSADPLAEAGR